MFATRTINDTIPPYPEKRQLDHALDVIVSNLHEKLKPSTNIESLDNTSPPSNLRRRTPYSSEREDIRVNPQPKDTSILVKNLEEISKIIGDITKVVSSAKQGSDPVGGVRSTEAFSSRQNSSEREDICVNPQPKDTSILVKNLEEISKIIGDITNQGRFVCKARLRPGRRRQINRSILVASKK
jgi:hypothetical protein